MKKRISGTLAIIATVAACVLASTFLTHSQPSSIQELQRGFNQPPDDARIMMRWWWFGPAVTKPELEREMRLMRAGGIGGFEVQPVYPVALDDPATGIETLPFLSDQFIDALKFTAEKANELGLRVDLTIGSGWPYGGPWVNANHAAGRLRVERVKLTEGKNRIPLPSIGGGEKLIAIFLCRFEGQSIVPGSAREITDTTVDGVRLPDSNGNEVQFFIASRTGQQVKRPAVGSEGFVLNHYDRAAVDHYLKSVGDRLMQAFPTKPPHAIFCDSLEVYLSDWTPDLLEEFRKRRGYDLRPNLPALVADMGERTSAIRHDWGMTLTELLNERFLVPMRDWAKRHGTLFRIQGYGVPPMTLSGNAYADLPEGEGSQWKVVRASRWASSASHLYGKRVTSSETWTWLHSPSFRATPLDVKAEADLHFLQGINQLIGHGWPYTPERADYPGGRFYAAGVFNEKNPWWLVMPDLARYLQRVSFLMRQGQPANDVALYLPNSDAWAGFSNGRIHLIEALREHVGPNVMPAILESGFNLDFIDDDALKKLGKVEQGALVLGTNRYKAVVLPNVERIPLESLKKLEQFVATGGVLIATRRAPDRAPGFLTSTTNLQAETLQISKRLFEGTTAKGHLVTDEKVELRSKLTSTVSPDVSLSPAVADVGFVRRHLDDAEIYFLANSSNVAHKVKASFRVSGLNAEVWDAMTGEVAAVDSVREGNRTALSLSFEPYSSTVVVFSRRSLSRAIARKPDARSGQVIDISGGWDVSYKRADGQAMNLPIARRGLNDPLRSWTESEGTRYFSGLGVYVKSVTVPADLLQGGLEWWLDVGEAKPVAPTNLRNGMRAWLEAPIRDAAEIEVNGQRAGSLWAPPYAINVTKLLKPGENRIRVVVANTAINHLAGQKLPDYRLLNLRYGERFQPQDMENLQPLPSGLLGPVRLIAK